MNNMLHFNTIMSLRKMLIVDIHTIVFIDTFFFQIILLYKVKAYICICMSQLVGRGITKSKHDNKQQTHKILRDKHVMCNVTLNSSQGNQSGPALFTGSEAMIKLMKLLAKLKCSNPGPGKAIMVPVVLHSAHTHSADIGVSYPRLFFVWHDRRGCCFFVCKCVCATILP